jgi:hypothetical protein
MEQWRAEHGALILEKLFMVTLLKSSEFCGGISILLVMEKFLAAAPYSYG